jgi:DNA-binding GntR family transcriptional regulator
MQEARAQFRTKREQAVARVKDAIMLGRYRPGQLLRQVQLMADLDLGATPAREAALELAAKGLLIHESRRGVRVAGVDSDRVAQVYQVRALVESEAARLSTLNATDNAIGRVARHAQAMESAFRNRDLKRLSAADSRFHRALYQGAGNPVLQGVIENLWEQFPRYMLWRDPARVMQSIAEHRGILQKFTRRDAPGTATAVRQHILNGMDALRVLLAMSGTAARVRA